MTNQTPERRYHRLRRLLRLLWAHERHTCGCTSEPTCLEMREALQSSIEEIVDVEEEER